MLRTASKGCPNWRVPIQMSIAPLCGTAVEQRSRKLV